jgi:hypothetical protein
MQMPMITDLALKDPAFSSDTLSVGTRTTITARVWNAGIRRTRRAGICFYLSRTEKITPDSVLIYHGTVPALAAAASHAVSRGYQVGTNVKPGRYFLIASLDPEAANNDPNRSNNVVVGRKCCWIKAAK